MPKRAASEDLSAPAYLKAGGMKIEAVRAAGKNGARSPRSAPVRNIRSAPVRNLRTVEDFKAAFDADAGKTRLVVLFSPT